MGWQDDAEKKIQELKRKIKCLKRRLAKTQKLARTGHLTGLPNRRGLEFEAKRALAQADRSKTPLSVLFIDLDFFKKINDTYGHEIGDDVLKEFAWFLKGAVRKSDVVARPGGDEFVVILPATNLDGARLIAEKIRKKLSEIQFTCKKISISISVGVASTTEDVETFAHLKRRADRRMYNAKQRRE